MEPVVTPVCWKVESTEGKAALRFGNLRAAEALIDFCLKPATGDYSLSVLRGTGEGCPAGFAYKDITALTYMAPGDYDIKVVEAGDTCDVAGLATLPSVRFDSEQHYAIMLVGDGDTTPLGVKVFPETTSTSAQGTTVRFINASTSLGTASMGPANQEQLVVTNDGVETRAILLDVYHENVEFGGVAKEDPSKHIDANGYRPTSNMSAPLNLGLAEGNATEVMVVVPQVPLPKDSLKTAVAVGLRDSDTYPVDLIVCDDEIVQGDTIFADCGAR